MSLMLADSLTMFRRDARHLKRYPVMTISGVLTPTFMMLLFVYLFGSAMTAGLGAGGPRYVDYLVPGILAMTIGVSGSATAVNVSTDMTQGIINRFRTMPISRASVLTGQVLGSLTRTLLAIVLVLGIGLLIGFRPSAGPSQWLAAIALMVGFTFALTWLTVAFGLKAKSPGGANGLSSPLLLLAFMSSAFVQPGTMSTGIRWFVTYQPFTAVIDTLRGLLTGTPIGDRGVLAVGWCVVITLVGYLWARRLYNRRSAR